MIVARAAALPRRLDSIQILRAIAVLIVMEWHSSGTSPIAMRSVPDYLYFGYAGVDLFFAISGFIMMHVTEGRQPEFVPFLSRRLGRIIPLYWIVLTGLLVAVLLFPRLGSVNGHGLDARYIFSSYFLIPMEIRPALGVAWSLQHEMLFYLIVGLLVSTANRRLLVPILLFLSLAALLIHTILFPVIGYVWDFKITSLFHIEFLAGVLAYYFVRHYEVKLPWIFATLGIAIFVCTGWTVAHLTRADTHFPTGNTLLNGTAGAIRAIGFGLGSFIVLVSTVGHRWELGGRSLVTRTLVAIGDASFVIYLIHSPIIQFFGKLSGTRMNSMINWEILLAASLGSICVLGVLISYYFEKPLTRIVDRLLLQLAAYANLTKVAR